MNAPVLEQSHEVLARHARSFRWGAFFLPRQQADDAAVVYALCRLVDDLADEAADPQEAERSLNQLREELEGRAAPRALVQAYLEVASRTGFGVGPARHLMEGVLGDLHPVRIADDGELHRYGYRVAGTVGLMMSGVLGVRRAGAAPHAVDLGVAMQITNICRDVAEDARMGRVYLPQTRLLAAGTSQEDVLAGRADPRAVSTVVQELLQEAERWYRSADEGMADIPWRSRLGIFVAARVYRRIGHALAGQGYDPLRGRAIVGWPQKLIAVAGAIGAWGRSLFTGSPHRHEDLHQHLRGLPGTDPDPVWSPGLAAE